jgi:hypothetical protein
VEQDVETAREERFGETAPDAIGGAGDLQGESR